MKKSNVMIGMFVGVVLVIGIVVFFTTRAKTAELEIISLDTKPVTDTVEQVGTLEKYYNVSSETVTIKSYDTKTELAKIRLDTPIDYKVGAGYQKVAQFTVSPYTDISSFIKSIELYNLNNNLQKFSRTIDIKYLSVGTKLVNDYKDECSTSFLKNGSNTTTCKEVLVGTHYEDEWKTYDGLLKTDKEITIGLFTNVEVGDKVEWIPTFTISSTDVKIQEWATWTADLNTNILSYYKLDGNSFLDSLGANNGTNSGTANTSGKILDGRDFVRTESDYINIGQNTIDLADGNFTINAWVTLDVLPSSVGAASNIISGGTNSYGFYVTDAGNYLRLGKIGVDQAPEDNIALTTGKWYMVTVAYDASANRVQYYLNGTATNNVAYSTTFSTGQDYFIGRHNYGGGAGGYWDGIIDEVGVWTRVLTATEVEQLYNSRNGLPYGIPQCNFSGYVKDSLGNGLNGASVVIFNQDNKTEIYNITSDSNGYWTKNITNSTKNFTAVAYFNNSLIGQAKPYISGTC